MSDLISEQNRIQQERNPQPRTTCGGNSHFGQHRFGGLRGGAGPPEDSEGDDDGEQSHGEEQSYGMDFGAVGYRPPADDVDNLSPISSIRNETWRPEAPAWLHGSPSGLRGGAPQSAQFYMGSNPSPFAQMSTADREHEMTFRRSHADSIVDFLATRNQGAHNAQPPARPPGDGPGPTTQLPTSLDNQPNRTPQTGVAQTAHNRDLYPEYYRQVARNQIQDDLRVSAYRNRQSVHEPNPAEPRPARYGGAVEGQLVVGNGSPSIYSNTAGLPDIGALMERNRHLENMVLDRETHCGICNKFFTFTTPEQRDAHFSGHSQIGNSVSPQLNSSPPQLTSVPPQLTAGVQPPHAASLPGDQASTPEKRIMESDVRLYCQCCGIDLFEFKNASQLIEHTWTCPGKRLANSEPSHCKFCGVQFPAIASREESQDHEKNCQGGKGEMDGRDPNLWTLATEVNHDTETTYWDLCALTGVAHFSDRSRPLGPYECRYAGCDADLEVRAHDGSLRQHHKMHISRGDGLKYICQDEQCKDDLAALDGQDMERGDQLETHMSNHFKLQCTFPNCGYMFRGNDISQRGDDRGQVGLETWKDHVWDHIIYLEDLERDMEGTSQPQQQLAPNPVANQDNLEGTSQPQQELATDPVDNQDNPNGNSADDDGNGHPDTSPEDAQVDSADGDDGSPPSEEEEDVDDHDDAHDDAGNRLVLSRIPDAWNRALGIVPRLTDRPWTFICPLCFSCIRNKQIQVRPLPNPFPTLY